MPGGRLHPFEALHLLYSLVLAFSVTPGSTFDVPESLNPAFSSLPYILE